MLFLFVAGLAIVATVGLTLSSLVTLVTAPGQLIKLMRDKALRRNHALEHATINVIEERFGRTNLAGLAQPEGFIIRGGAPPELIASAAQEALARLRAGERHLAIHPRCGTTVVISQILMALGFLIVLFVTRQLTWLPFLVGMLAAALLGPRLSPILQRFVTTDAEMGTLAITGIEAAPVTNAFGMFALVTMGPILVRTDQEGGSPPPTGATGVTSEWDEIPIEDYRVR